MDRLRSEVKTNENSSCIRTQNNNNINNIIGKKKGTKKIGYSR